MFIDFMKRCSVKWEKNIGILHAVVLKALKSGKRRSDWHRSGMDSNKVRES